MNRLPKLGLVASVVVTDWRDPRLWRNAGRSPAVPARNAGFL